MNPDKHRIEEISTDQDQQDDKGRPALKKRFYKVPLKDSNDTLSPDKSIYKGIYTSQAHKITEKYQQIISDPVPPQLKNLSYLKYLKQDQREQNLKTNIEFAVSHVSPKMKNNAKSKTKCLCFL